MKRISHSKVNFILLIFITIWVSIILIAQAIPDLKLILRVTNRMIKEISYGYNPYADNIFKQTNIIYPIAYNILYTSTLVCIAVISILSIFKPQMIKALGMLIIAQNTFLLSLKWWNKFLTNKVNDTVLIDIKMFLGIISLAIIIFVLISFKQKIFYLLLMVMTLLQCFNIISFSLEYVRSISNIYVIFECFCEILILIPYWIVSLSMNKSDKLTANINK